ncbi:MAG: helix-turn-helix transcriptional regulator [Candidatus Acidiferrales bacterium]
MRYPSKVEIEYAEAREFKRGSKTPWLSQQKAARALGVSQTYLSMLETGERVVPNALARKFVRAYRLPPTSLPPTMDRWTPGWVDPQKLAEELADLGYPGLAYLRDGHSAKNPAEVLLDTLARDKLEARLFEALPWLLLNYWTMDTKWLVEQAKLHDPQNRLGFVVTLARSATTPATHNDARQDALESLELSLKRSLRARNLWETRT